MEVSLRQPPPLERQLQVRPGDEGGALLLLDGEVVVAEARPGELELDVPAPPSVADAEAASQQSFYRRAAEHAFPGCFVCGPDREPGDGLRIFPGSAGGDLHAATWTPERSLADEDGAVRTEFVWAALDCPSSAPVMSPSSNPPIVLARMTARLEGPVWAGRPYVLAAWPLGTDGRKRHAGSAIFGEDGECLGLARALWIELR